MSQGQNSLEGDYTSVAWDPCKRATRLYIGDLPCSSMWC